MHNQHVTFAFLECCGATEISVIRGCDSCKCIAKHRTISYTSTAAGGNFDVVVESTGVDFYVKAGMPYCVVFAAKGECPACICSEGFGIFKLR
jgi:hypothetical protein